MQAFADGAAADLGGLRGEVGVMDEAVEQIGAQQIAGKADLFGRLNEQRRTGAGLLLLAREDIGESLAGGVGEQAAADQELFDMRTLRHGNPSFHMVMVSWSCSFCVSIYVRDKDIPLL